MHAPAPSERAVPLVHLKRSDLLESQHAGHFVLLRAGEIVARGGDIDRPVFVRSAAKPVQAMVGVLSGAVEQFALDDRCLAVAAGSHSATPTHVAAVRDLLARANLSEQDLRCGGHWSIDATVARTQALPDGSDTFPAIWSNCSGKHAMMLAAARAWGEPLAKYLEPAHRVQQCILETFGALIHDTSRHVPVAIDGCGAPAPTLSLATMAHALARFATPTQLPEPFRSAAQRVGDAIRAHPDLVAGPHRFDTDLMQAAATPLIAKCGAEGVFSVMAPAHRTTLVVKVEDGNDRGYRLFVLALLQRLGILTATAATSLSERHAPETLRNHAGTIVGTAHAIVPDVVPSRP